MNKILCVISFILLASNVFSSETRELKEEVVVLLEPTKAEYKLSEPVIIKVTIKNGSKERISTIVSNVLRKGSITILNSKGERVPLTSYGKKMKEMRKSSSLRSFGRIGRNEELSFKINISELFKVDSPSIYQMSMELSYFSTKSGRKNATAKPTKFKVIE